MRYRERGRVREREKEERERERESERERKRESLTFEYFFKLICLEEERLALFFHFVFFSHKDRS